MKIGVLDLCVWLPEYQHDQARFGEVVADWARQRLPDARFEVIDIEWQDSGYGFDSTRAV